MTTLIRLWGPHFECQFCGADDVNHAIEAYEGLPCEGSGFYLHACKDCHDKVYGAETKP